MSIPHVDHIVNQLERKIYGITSQDQMQDTKEFSIRWAECDPWWSATGIHELGKTIEQCVIQFGYRKMHLLRLIS
jgi:hypothetical protein